MEPQLRTYNLLPLKHFYPGAHFPYRSPFLGSTQVRVI